MKYIMFEWPGLDEVPLLFPNCISHDDVANIVHRTYPGVTPVSAGFCEVEATADQDTVAYAFGNSTSLNLKPREVDARIISRVFQQKRI